MAEDFASKLRGVVEAADALGTDTTAVRALTGGVPDYAQALPALSDLADNLPASTAVRNDAVALLQQLRTTESGGPQGSDAQTQAAPRELYTDLKTEYVQLFATCTVQPERAALVAWHVHKLVSGQAAYQRVGARLGIPWHFVGIAHGLEASFRFDCHLHNGDPLTHRTVQYPPGRPPVWNPPTDWDSSAIDALTLEGFAHQQDWSLPRTLYRWEAYNGFGSRHHGIHTPYLWSFSNHYTAGKYVSDGKWDGHVVSKQCGAAVMLKALIDGGHAAAPTNT